VVEVEIEGEEGGRLADVVVVVVVVSGRRRRLAISPSEWLPAA
jgi:hypothetical protein